MNDNTLVGDEVLMTLTKGVVVDGGGGNGFHCCECGNVTVICKSQ